MNFILQSHNFFAHRIIILYEYFIIQVLTWYDDVLLYKMKWKLQF